MDMCAEVASPKPAGGAVGRPSPALAGACLGVVMPVYNEAATLETAIRSVLAQPLVAELIVVDDASTDGSAARVEPIAAVEPRVRLLRHERNQGKGAALRTGFTHVRAPVVIVQDADLEYDPAEYPVLLGPIVAGKADVVFGSRFQGAGAHRVLYFWHAMGNRVLTLLSNMLTNLNLTDVETCYKVFRRDVLARIQIEEPRFGFEIEVIAKVSRLRVRLYEVPISYHGRTYAEGKKATWRDGVSALRCLVKYNLC